MGAKGICVLGSLFGQLREGTRWGITPRAVGGRMTARKRLKRLVRTRAAKTGESYTSALRHFRDETRKERVMSQPQARPPARCSFCGKYQDQVEKLIAGPGVFICDECITLCLEIIRPPAGVEAQSASSDRSNDVPDHRAAPADVEGRARSFLAEALGSIEAGEAPGTPLAESIDVTRTAIGIRVDVHTARPGALIGRGGAVAEGLRSGLRDVVGSDVALNIVPIE